jgi:hypothetical protein
VVDVGDHHRANASVAWARSDLGSLDIKANGPESPGLSLFWTQPRTSQCSSTGATGQAALIDGEGGLPMTNPKADHRARDEPGVAPAANVASAVDFYAQRSVSP